MEQIDKIFELCARIEAKINEIHDELDKLGIPKIDRETGEDIEENNNNNSGDNSNTNVTYDGEIVFKYNDTNNNNESYIYDINRSK